jgi:hypothetical protein
MGNLRLLPISQPSVPIVGARKRDGFLDDRNPSLERYPLRVRCSWSRRSFAAWSIANPIAQCDAPSSLTMYDQSAIRHWSEGR